MREYDPVPIMCWMIVFSFFLGYIFGAGKADS